MKYCISFALSVLCACFGRGQTLETTYRESREAFEIQDFERYLSLTRQALQFHPSHPELLLNEVEGLILCGLEGEASMALARYLSWDASDAFRRKPALDSFNRHSRYGQSLDRTRREYLKNLQQSETFLSRGEKQHFEDIALTPDYIILSEVNQGAVHFLSRQDNRPVAKVSLPGSALSLLVGDDGQSLYATSSVLPQFAGYNPEQEHQAYLIRISIATKTVESSLEIPGESIPGSMASDGKGTIFISDSMRPVLYRVQARNLELAEIIKVPDAFNLQGVAYSAEDQKLYVADYIKGILRLDANDLSNRHWLRSPDFLLKGIDGLAALDPRNLIAIQNNSTPMRLVRIALDASGEVAGVHLLDNNLDLGGEPTNGKFWQGTDFFYIANSPWPYYDTDTHMPQTDHWKGVVVNRIRL